MGFFSRKVEIKQGTVIGGEAILPNGNPYYFFKGIPFAVPPLGKLRFKAPIPLEKFSVPELECIKEGPNSIQQDRVTGKPYIGSEDCLYLNVFTPKSKTNSPLPVMLYIHGGGFTTGSGNSDKHNPLYLLQEGVVVVTFNYRLGVLGFLSLPEAGIPGNAGLKDQVLVMKWVKENISKFNGDPNIVTLFGNSTGGTSAQIHMYSKNSKQLFNGAIMQSGVATMPSMIDNDASAKTINLARSNGCSSDDPHDILKFLQDFNNLEAFISPLTELFKTDLPAKPVIEADSPEAVITKPILEALRQSNSVEIPVLMGYTNAEGLAHLGRYGDNLKDFHNDICKFVPQELYLPNDDLKKHQLAELIEDFYLKGEKVDSKMIYQLSELVGDSMFSWHIRQSAELHTLYQHKSPLYFYRFDFDGQLNLYKTKFKMDHLKGAAHVDELCYVFQMEFGPPEPWEEEAHKMVLTVCKMWANFAKFGNPTPAIEKVCDSCQWEPVPKVDDSDGMIMKTLIFDKEIRILDNPDEERMSFWRKLSKCH